MTKKVLLIDNYDSFTYNLVQYLQDLGASVIVKKNNEISVTQAQNLNPDYLVFSPGPGSVKKADDIGIGFELLKAFRGSIPILGVCLGHQMIGHFFGGQIKATKPHHGEQWSIKVLDKTGVFKGFKNTFLGMRYHSLIVTAENLDQNLKITAVTNDEHQHIMALEKTDEPIFGVQFHPESVGTKEGLKILENFLNI